MFIHNVTYVSFAPSKRYTKDHWSGDIFAELKEGITVRIVMHFKTAEAASKFDDACIDYNLNTNDRGLNTISDSCHDVTQVELVEEGNGMTIKVTSEGYLRRDYDLFLTSKDD